MNPGTPLKKRSKIAETVTPVLAISTFGYLAYQASFMSGDEIMLFGLPLLFFGSYIAACLMGRRGSNLTASLCASSLLFASFGLWANGQSSLAIGLLVAAVVTSVLRINAEVSPRRGREIDNVLVSVDLMLTSAAVMLALCSVYLGLWLIEAANVVTFLVGSGAVLIGGYLVYQSRMFGHVLLACGGVVALALFSETFTTEVSTLIALFVCYELMRWRWKCKDKFELEGLIVSGPPPIVAGQTVTQTVSPYRERRRACIGE